MRPLNGIALALVIAQVGAACGPTKIHDGDAPRRDARLITHEAIMKTGATDAFQALRRVGSYLNLSDRKGQVRATDRGRTSFLLSPQITLVIDGVMMADLNTLKSIPAENVDWMRVMTSIEATPVYGTQGSNGVLLVATRIPDTE